MIRFSLKCAADHRFESWFQSAAAYDKLAGARMIACAECGSTDVTKDVMAPSIRPMRGAADAAANPPKGASQNAVARMRAKLEANAEYVGTDFARTAREIHEGTAPERAIYGEAPAREARKLLEDGVPIFPLPFRPARKLN